ncbi:MAG: hypothetical protein Ta2E_01140 [Mycoplasmoidaceae bacterium]|nr:MAG: hypothetical protein Ta2E_01140 [Mycoplasmoidaceae bacterium]
MNQGISSNDIDINGMNINLGRLQQMKDIYDQRYFENKSSLQSKINKISTNREGIERIKAKRDEICLQAKKEKDAINHLEAHQKLLEADMDNRDKRIAERKAREA